MTKATYSNPLRIAFFLSCIFLSQTGCRSNQASQELEAPCSERQFYRFNQPETNPLEMPPASQFPAASQFPTEHQFPAEQSPTEQTQPPILKKIPAEPQPSQPSQPEKTKKRFPPKLLPLFPNLKPKTEKKKKPKQEDPEDLFLKQDLPPSPPAESPAANIILKDDLIAMRISHAGRSREHHKAIQYRSSQYRFRTHPTKNHSTKNHPAKNHSTVRFQQPSKVITRNSFPKPKLQTKTNATIPLGRNPFGRQLIQLQSPLFYDAPAPTSRSASKNFPTNANGTNFTRSGNNQSHDGITASPRIPIFVPSHAIPVKQVSGEPRKLWFR